LKFTISKSKLLTDLAAAQGVTEKKSTIPVLSNVLLDAGVNSLTLRFTDLDLSLTLRVDADVAQAGAICVQAKKLFDIVRALPDGELDFRLDDKDQLHLKCGSSRFKLLTMPAGNFPEIKSHDGPWLQFPAKLIQRFIARTLFAITTEESRYALNGAKLEIADCKARMVATDGHRLAFIERQGFGDASLDALIPKKTLGELARLCADVEGDIEIALADNHLFARIGARLLSSRTLTGQFPNYELVLPKENHNRVTVEREALLRAVKRVALMADDRTHAMKLTFGDNAIQLEAQTSEAGEAAETVSADYQGPEIIAAFNAQYVLDALAPMDSVSVVIALKDGNSQVDIQPVGEEAEVYRSIIMPCRL
jgi:DNA polymerase-3 subunit beta